MAKGHAIIFDRTTMVKRIKDDTLINIQITDRRKSLSPESQLPRVLRLISPRAYEEHKIFYSSVCCGMVGMAFCNL